MQPSAFAEGGDESWIWSESDESRSDHSGGSTWGTVFKELSQPVSSLSDLVKDMLPLERLGLVGEMDVDGVWLKGEVLGRMGQIHEGGVDPFDVECFTLFQGLPAEAFSSMQFLLPAGLHLVPLEGSVVTDDDGVRRRRAALISFGTIGGHKLTLKVNFSVPKLRENGKTGFEVIASLFKEGDFVQDALCHVAQQEDGSLRSRNPSLAWNKPTGANNPVYRFNGTFIVKILEGLRCVLAQRLERLTNCTGVVTSIVNELTLR